MMPPRGDPWMEKWELSCRYGATEGETERREMERARSRHSIVINRCFESLCFLFRKYSVPLSKSMQHPECATRQDSTVFRFLQAQDCHVLKLSATIRMLRSHARGHRSVILDWTLVSDWTRTTIISFILFRPPHVTIENQTGMRREPHGRTRRPLDRARRPIGCGSWSC
jgi:hypothetical protein